MSKPSISPPLPLPIGLKLLPSLLPGKQLTPCLYTEINDLPIFLIVSPTSEPQLSFLSLILALKHKELASPQWVWTWYDPTPGNYHPTLNGLAPWSDLWVPLSLARRIVREIGVERLFWDNKGRGLLGDVDDAVSWEEDGGWSHNWLPAKTHLPTSSYSFDNLLSTKWPSIEVIPDQRCVHTAADAQRLFRLVSDGRFGNPSTIREGIWNTVWNALLEWSKRSCTGDAMSPLSASVKKPTDQDEPISTLIRSIPALFNLPSTPAPPIFPADMNSLFPSGDISIAALVLELFINLWNALLAFLPTALMARLTISPDRQPESKKIRARINLALCALAWDIVIGIWHLKRDNARLRRALEEGGIKMRPDIKASKSTPNPEDQYTLPPMPPLRHKTTKGDDITRLEKRRGASPPPLQTPESSPSPSGSSGSERSESRVKQSKPHSPLSRKRKTGDFRTQLKQAAPVGSARQSSRVGRSTFYNLDQHVQPPASSGSGSDWFDVSPRKQDRPGEDHEKISRWYSRSPRRSSESDSSSGSEESDHLPTPYQVSVPLPLLDHRNLSPPPDYQQTPPSRKYVGPVEGDDVYHFSHRSDRWLNDDCDPDYVEEEPTGFMSFPFVVDIVDFVTSPIIAVWLGMGLIMFVAWWWESDPPEPAVVVL